MAVIGELTVNLQAQTASFHDSLGKANSGLQEFGEKGEAAGRAMETSMGSARGGLMLTEHLLGVPLPRHLNSLIAQIPGVGAAFATMLPIVGVLLAVEILGKLYDKHRDAEAAIRATTLATQQFESKQADSVLMLDNANMKLEDQIRIIEHGAAKNKLAIQMNEIKIEADKLTDGFQTDFQKMDTEITKQDTLWHNVMDTVKKYGASVISAMSEGAVDAEQSGSNAAIAGYNKRKEAIDAANAAVIKLHEAEAIRADIDPKKDLAGWEVATGKVATAAGEVQAAFDRAHDAVLAVDPTATVLADHLKQNALTGKAEWKSMTDEITNANDRVALNAAENAEKGRKAYVKWWEATSKAVFDAGKIADESAKETSKIETERLENQIHGEIKAGEESSKAFEKELKNTEQAYQAQEKVNSAVAEEAKARNKVAEIGIKSDVNAGIISKQKEQGLLKAVLIQENKDQQDAFATRYAAALNNAADLNKLAAAPGLTTDDREKALDKATEAQAKANQLLSQNNVLMAQNAAAIRAADVEQKRLTGDFNQWITDMKKDMPTTAKMMEQDFTKAMDSVNSGFAKSVVEGKNFGKAMKQVGAQLLESVIEQEMKKLEVYLMGLLQRKAADTAGDAAKVAEATATAAAMKTLAASEAGAWAFESVMADLPFPANVAAAPEVAMSAVAQALAFAKGGVVPGDGYGDTVPAMLTPGETVVTKALTQQVAQSQGGGSNRGHVIQHSPTYNVTTMDSRGFSAMLEKHDAEFQKHAVSTLRKLNVRAGRG